MIEINGTDNRTLFNATTLLYDTTSLMTSSHSNLTSAFQLPSTSPPIGPASTTPAAAHIHPMHLAPGCVLFNFVVHAVFVGVLCLLGFAADTLCFALLWREQCHTGLTFLLQASCLADLGMYGYLYNIY